MKKINHSLIFILLIVLIFFCECKSIFNNQDRDPNQYDIIPSTGAIAGKMVVDLDGFHADSVQFHIHCRILDSLKGVWLPKDGKSHLAVVTKEWVMVDSVKHFFEPETYTDAPFFPEVDNIHPFDTTRMSSTRHTYPDSFGVGLSKGEYTVVPNLIYIMKSTLADEEGYFLLLNVKPGEYAGCFDNLKNWQEYNYYPYTCSYSEKTREKITVKPDSVSILSYEIPLYNDRTWYKGFSEYNKMRTCTYYMDVMWDDESPSAEYLYEQSWFPEDVIPLNMKNIQNIKTIIDSINNLNRALK